MGVKDFWKIVASTCEKVPIASLKNLSLAVDLSTWIMESTCSHKKKYYSPKPYLRNLFCRVIHLTNLGVKLVFILDGDAPSLKQSVMEKRYNRIASSNTINTTNVRAKNSHPESSGIRRSLLRVHTNECVELLTYLGMNCIQAYGEAEALCALLNLNGIVDGVLTSDSDVFLYGALVVYRGYSMRDNTIERYSISSIREILRISREDMVGLSVLLGSDFYPGVHKVGKASCIKLIQTLTNPVTLLDVIRKWNEPEFTDVNCESSLEKSIFDKFRQAEKFNLASIIDEFFTINDKITNISLYWIKPDLKKLEYFMLYNLDWREDYTREKAFSLMTLFYIAHAPTIASCFNLEPVKIIKLRRRNNILLYEIQWEGSGYLQLDNTDFGNFSCHNNRTQLNLDSGSNNNSNNNYSTLTLESIDSVNSAFPLLVQSYYDNLTSRTKKKRRKADLVTNKEDNSNPKDSITADEIMTSQMSSDSLLQGVITDYCSTGNIVDIPDISDELIESNLCDSDAEETKLNQINFKSFCTSIQPDLTYSSSNHTTEYKQSDCIGKLDVNTCFVHTHSGRTQYNLDSAIGQVRYESQNETHYSPEGHCKTIVNDTNYDERHVNTLLGIPNDIDSSPCQEESEMFKFNVPIESDIELIHSHHIMHNSVNELVNDQYNGSIIVINDSFEHRDEITLDRGSILSLPLKERIKLKSVISDNKYFRDLT